MAAVLPATVEYCMYQVPIMTIAYLPDMKALFTAIINDDPLPKENDQNAQTLGTSQTSGSGSSTGTSTPSTRRTCASTGSSPARR